MPFTLDELIEYLTLSWFISMLFSMGSKLEIPGLKIEGVFCGTFSSSWGMSNIENAYCFSMGIL